MAAFLLVDMSKKTIRSQINSIMDAARERARTTRRETGNPEVFRILDRILDGAEIFKRRGEYFDVAISEAKRIGDSSRVAELKADLEVFFKDLQRFKFLAETAFEQLAPKGEQS
jgi:hypothetical protein